MEGIKLSIGLDISKPSFCASIVLLQSDQHLKIVRSRSFSNTLKGIVSYMDWAKQTQSKYDLAMVHVMESTGVYHELLALTLYKHGEQVHVVLPNKSRKYAQALGIKTKNDKVDAKALGMLGAQQVLEVWAPMGDFFYQLRGMTRMYQSYQEHISSLNNQKEALEHGMYKQDHLIKDLTDIINTYKKVCVNIKDQIQAHLASDQQVKSKVEGICKLKGVSWLTVAVLLAETNSFLLFKNSRQLVSYSGYDVVENQSGKHTGRTKISKQGNSRIRRALFMPAFTAVTHEARFKVFYDRILASTHIPMKGYVAVQKKLLVIIYSLWKSGQAYDPHYLKSDTTGDNEQVYSSRVVLEENKIVLPDSSTIQGIQTVEKSQYMYPLGKGKYT